MSAPPAVHHAEVTVRAVLDLPVIAAAEPLIVNGADELDSPVRWVHIAEGRDVVIQLEGRELLLSSSSDFYTSAAHTRTFLRRLERLDAAGFIVEVTHPDPAAVTAAVEVLRTASEGLRIPVIALQRTARFVRVTQDAHQLIIGRQLARVERAKHVHDVFTELSLQAADEQTIVSRTAQLTDSPVVLEDASHRVLAFDSHRLTTSQLLDSWPQESGLQVPVGIQGHRWGRLVAVDPGDDDAAEILERAGQAITLVRMATQNDSDMLFSASDRFLRELADHPEGDPAALAARARALGLTGSGTYVPLAVQSPDVHGADPRAVADQQLRERGIRTALSAAVKSTGSRVITASWTTGTIAALVLTSRSPRAVLASISADLSSSLGTECAIGVGRFCTSLADAGPELEVAAQTADVASRMSVRDRPYYRFSDLRLRGLMADLRDDPRLQAFARAELGELLRDEHAELLTFLTVHLQNSGAKSAIAQQLRMSRPAVYAKTRRVEDLLGVSLGDAESRASLYTALLILQIH